MACQGSGVVAPALLAGRPVLMLPNPVEQMMTLYRVARQGYGQGVAPEADMDIAGAALRRLLDDPDCRLRAANFARSYHGYTPATATDTIIEECLDLLDPSRDGPGPRAPDQTDRSTSEPRGKTRDPGSAGIAPPPGGPALEGGTGAAGGGSSRPEPGTRARCTGSAPAGGAMENADRDVDVNMPSILRPIS